MRVKGLRRSLVTSHFAHHNADLTKRIERDVRQVFQKINGWSKREGERKENRLIKKNQKDTRRAKCSTSCSIGSRMYCHQ